jgi:rubredoxin---NAD+ reductase
MSAGEVLSVLVFRQYLCKACGLIYDEALGDPDSGLAPGTRFEAIPDAWMCPICGVGKGDFELCVTAKRNFSKANSESAISVPSVSISTRNALPIVIAGAGVAGWSVAQLFRDYGFNGDIVMLSNSDGTRYHKPQISVACASKKSALDLVIEDAQVAANRLQVRLLNKRWVASISPSSNTISTSHGSVKYRQLVLALGAVPRRLPTAWAEHCWQINQLQDYDRLTKHLENKQPPQRIAVIGAGLVGIELADDLAVNGHRVTIIEYENRPLAGLASKAQSDELLESLAKNRIDVKVQTQVSGVDRKASGEYEINLVSRFGAQARFSLDADIVIAAIGLVGDKRLANHSGLAFADGFSVDPIAMRTNVPNIYALGDCAAINGRVQRYIEPIARQAKTIVHAILNLEPVPFSVGHAPIRLKSRSLPLTFR